MVVVEDFGMRQIRVLVMDHQVSVSEMVSIVLNIERFAVVAEAASGVEGLRLFAKYKPNLVITSLTLLEINGPEMIRRMRAETPDFQVIIYTDCTNRELVFEGLDLRPDGFVHKTEKLVILRQALKMIVLGGTFLSPYASRMLAEVRSTEAVSAVLSPQERKVLKMAADGMSSKEVAGQLFLSPRTVEHYRMSLMRKLGLRDVASLTRYAMICGISQIS